MGLLANVMFHPIPDIFRKGIDLLVGLACEIRIPLAMERYIIVAEVNPEGAWIRAALTVCTCRISERVLKKMQVL